MYVEGPAPPFAVQLHTCKPLLCSNEPTRPIPICSSLQTNMATLRGCSCCVNQRVGGFTLPGVLCCRLFTHHCPTTSHSHCSISLLDTVLAQQPYCTVAVHHVASVHCLEIGHYLEDCPGVVLNLKVGCMTRRLLCQKEKF